MMDVLGRRIVRGRKVMPADGEHRLYAVVGGRGWCVALAVTPMAVGGLVWLSWVWR